MERPDIQAMGKPDRITRVTSNRSRPSGVGRKQKRPIWRPVAAVGMLTAVVNEQLKHTRDLLALMEQARPSRPDARIVDDYTVSETLRIYGQMAVDYRSLFAEQGRRWQAETISNTTIRQAVNAYTQLVDEHLAVLRDLLTLARQVQSYRFEKATAKKRPRTGTERR